MQMVKIDFRRFEELLGDPQKLFDGFNLCFTYWNVNSSNSFGCFVRYAEPIGALEPRYDFFDAVEVYDVAAVYAVDGGALQAVL